MKKDQHPSKEQNKNNLKRIKLDEEHQTEKEKNELELKIEKPQKKSPEEQQKELELKSKTLNKPKELLNFDAVAHFKENIANTDKNCLGPITEKSYYCIACKHSECPLYNENKNQKEHLLIKRVKCLFYDDNFFNSVEKNINESLTYHQMKDSLKECVNNSINTLKDELEKIREKKIQEIDQFFEETNKYLLDLKNKCLNARQSIEDYYKVNKKFFNISISKDTNNDGIINNDLKEKNLAKSDINNNLQDKINVVQIDTGDTNRDIENAVFLLNFELMNLCETKNLEIIDMIKKMKLKIDSYNVIMQDELNKNIDITSKFFNFDFKSEKIEDYYWDILIRTKKYSEMIQQFRETITEKKIMIQLINQIKDIILPPTREIAKENLL